MSRASTVVAVVAGFGALVAWRYLPAREVTGPDRAASAVAYAVVNER